MIALPSARSPVFVTITPPGTASRTDVRLFSGNGAGVYLDFATLTFQVPMELSAPKASPAISHGSIAYHTTRERTAGRQNRRLLPRSASDLDTGLWGSGLMGTRRRRKVERYCD